MLWLKEDKLKFNSNNEVPELISKTTVDLTTVSETQEE